VYQGPLLSRGGGWGNARYTGNPGVPGYGGRDVIERERRARMRRYECVNAPLLTATRFVGGTAAPSPPRPAPAPSPRPAGRPVGPSSVDSARRLFGAIVLFSTSASRPLPPALAPPPCSCSCPFGFFPVLALSLSPLRPRPFPFISFYFRALVRSSFRFLLVPSPPRPPRPPLD